MARGVICAAPGPRSTLLGPPSRNKPRRCSLGPQAQEEELEDPLVEEFKALRRKLFAWQSEAAAARREWRRSSGAACRCPAPAAPCCTDSPVSTRLAGWDAVDPLEYLAPFLETVKSPETSGPITLVALSALQKIIARGVLGGCFASIWRSERLAVWSFVSLGYCGWLAQQCVGCHSSPLLPSPQAAWVGRRQQRQSRRWQTA